MHQRRLDKQFSGNGKVITGFTADSEDEASDVYLQTDSKIIATGSSGGNFAMIRYNPNGSLDNSFSGDGKLVTDIKSEYQSEQFILRPSGKMLVFGYTDEHSFEIARYTQEGRLDTSFSKDGKLTLELEQHYRVAVQMDGKILVSGMLGHDIVVTRYFSDGQVDTEFGKAGTMSISSFGLPGQAGHWLNRAIDLQDDGKILIYGVLDTSNDSSKIGVVRLNTNGSLDTGFLKDMFNNLPDYKENGSPVVLNHAVQIYDQELADQGNYSGSTLTLVRHTGANDDDSFTGVGSLAFSTGKVLLSGIEIGTVDTHISGQLSIRFNEQATQERVNKVLASIAYENTSEAPPNFVRIDWTFNDGNTGKQGSGGALVAQGFSRVHIISKDDASTGKIAMNGVAAEGQTLWPDSLSLIDPDGINNLQYHWIVNKTVAVTGSHYTVKHSDIGKHLHLKVTYVEDSGYIRTLETNYAIIGRYKSGSDKNDTINGHNGSDILIGHAGNDELIGGGGDDVLKGGNGNDTLIGGYGIDTLTGGAGYDRFLIDSYGYYFERRWCINHQIV